MEKFDGIIMEGMDPNVYDVNGKVIGRILEIDLNRCSMTITDEKLMQNIKEGKFKNCSIGYTLINKKGANSD